MKHLLLILLAILLSSVGATAQTIFDRLETSIGMEGEVVIYQDQRIKQLVGRTTEVRQDGNAMFLLTQGYRIQVFSGNKQRASKEEAFAKESKIKSEFTDFPTYVTFNSPFWKLRMGDFRTYEEADDILRELRRKFPDFSKEMFIVREEIKIPFV